MTMSMKDNIWIFSDLANRYGELAAGAASLNSKAQAIVVGSEADAHTAATSGASIVHAIAYDSARVVDDYLPEVAKIIKASGSSCLVLVAASRRGRAMAARLAVQLDAAVISDVTGFSCDGEGLKVTHNVYGGLAVATEAVRSERAVLLVAPGAFDPAENTPAGQVSTVNAEASSALKCLGHHPKRTSAVELNRARRVVGAGRGIKAKEDLAMVEALAKAIEAEVGCSRPLAEGEHWFENELYIGITGVKLKADVYLALGVSGQVQHMAGVMQSRTIVAVNKDKNAPVFSQCDYGLVGDLYKVLPALTKLMA